jgi:hypothetical protein
MDLASALTDDIGGRLTGSPNMEKANNWTRDQLTRMGLVNAHLEDWGEFGMGWQQLNTWVRMTAPDTAPFIAQATPWSPATNGAVTGEAINVNIDDEKDFDKYKGKLAGKIVLLGEMRDVPPVDKPLFERYTDKDLEELAEYPSGDQNRDYAKRVAQYLKRYAMRDKIAAFLVDERAAGVILPSRDGKNSGGSGGTFFDDNGAALGSQPYKADKAVKIPVVVTAIENYGRVYRLLQAHVPVTLEMNVETKMTGDHQHGFDTVAEIPGTDPTLKDQIVMVGGHLDSWASATGATDNGAGTVVAMEAVRILKALDVHPKRTIRIALWTGEEEGEYGSAGYVKQHFGTFAPAANPDGQPAYMTRTRGPLTVTKEWENLDAYYNLDNGTGKVRGVYTQGNLAIAPIFAQWIAPLRDLGVTTITTRNTGGTDHQSYDAVGLPGFQYIQDPMDYDTRTHHSDMDTFDRLHEADLEQSAIVEAIFLWNTSERETMMPRKPFPHPEDEQKLGAPIKGLYPGATSDDAPATGGGRRRGGM